MSGFTGGFGGFGNIRKNVTGNPRMGIRKTGGMRNRSFGGFRRGGGNVRYPTKRA